MSAAESEVLEKELVVSTTDQALMMAISKAELDQAITTARAYPRSVKSFLNECMQLATLNEQIADECIYALPRREKDRATNKWIVKNIEGPSTRLAEIVVHSWGNARTGARIVDEGRDFVTAQGVFHDLEKNVHITMEVRRRITTKNGDRFNADMIGVTGNAACSIAMRNAVFRGVPKALWLPIYQAADKVCRGDSKTLANRRADALAVLQKFGATQEMVLAYLGVKGIEDITLDHLVTLTGVKNAIKDGTTTVEEAFAPPQEEQTQANGTTAQRAKDILRGGAPKAPEPPPNSAPAASTEVPQYSTTTAIEKLRTADSTKALDAAWRDIAKDYKDTNRDVPIEVEAARNERRESLQL